MKSEVNYKKGANILMKLTFTKTYFRKRFFFVILPRLIFANGVMCEFLQTLNFVNGPCLENFQVKFLSFILIASYTLHFTFFTPLHHVQY